MRCLQQSIRSAVSDLRDNHSVDIVDALSTLVEGLPGIAVELDWPADIKLDAINGELDWQVGKPGLQLHLSVPLAAGP